jgi:hypothetical protein
MKKNIIHLGLGFLVIFSIQQSNAQQLTNRLARTIKSRAVLPKAKAVDPNAPTITSISLTTTNGVTIFGTNLAKVITVKFGTVVAASFDNSGAPTSVVAIPQPSSSVNDGLTVITAPTDSLRDTVTFKSTGLSSPSGLNASADFTLPDLGQDGINVVVTPSFFYNQIYSDKKIAFSGTVWGNNFGTDSIRSKVASKLLLPESSSFGFKLEGAYLFDPGKTIVVGLAAEANFLSKKISFLDTTSKETTNFNPFVIHPKVGVTISAFNSAVVASAYLNLLTVQTDNDSFGKFFNTNKNLFLYPEFNISGIVNLKDATNQAIKVGFDMIDNNNNTKILTSSSDKLIVYLKIGFVSAL